MVPMGDAINKILITYLTPNCDKQPQFSKQVNYYFVKTTLFFIINSTNLKIFLGSNPVVNMAANMLSMWNWLLSRSSMIILTKCIHCGSPVGARTSLFDSANKTIFDIGRTNTRLTKVFDCEFPM